MEEEAPSYNMKSLPPRERRLAKEHIELYEMCQRTNKIHYEITKQLSGFPPEGYKVFYEVKSITAINDQQEPQYENQHTASIEFPPEYPGDAGKPICYMLTDTWHPNIKSSGPYKGRICVDAKSLGAWFSLDMLVQRIGEILQYKNYLAEDRPPFPEDTTVAQWVREYAEPKGIVGEKNPVDPENLLQPVSEDYQPRELKRPSSSISIKIRKKDATSRPESTNETETPKLTKGSISISKRNK